jgi:hypothetical protein
MLELTVFRSSLDLYYNIILLLPFIMLRFAVFMLFPLPSHLLAILIVEVDKYNLQMLLLPKQFLKDP